MSIVPLEVWEKVLQDAGMKPVTKGALAFLFVFAEVLFPENTHHADLDALLRSMETSEETLGYHRYIVVMHEVSALIDDTDTGSVHPWNMCKWDSTVTSTWSEGYMRRYKPKGLHPDGSPVLPDWYETQAWGVLPCQGCSSEEHDDRLTSLPILDSWVDKTAILPGHATVACPIAVYKTKLGVARKGKSGHYNYDKHRAVLMAKTPPDFLRKGGKP